MKKNLFLLIAVIIVSCKTTEKNVVLISGVIENPKSEFVVFSAYEQFQDTAYLDSLNSFSIEIPVEEPVLNVNLLHGGEYAPMYFEPGMDLTIHLNTEQFDETLTYEGKGSDENSFLIGLLLLAEKNNFKEYDLYRLEVSEFRSQLDSFYRIQKDYLNEKCAGKKEDYFWKKQSAVLLYRRARILFNYPNYFKYFTGADSVDLGENYDNYLDELELDNSEYLGLTDYIAFLNGYLRKEAGKNFEEALKRDSTTRYNMSRMNTILTLFSDEKIQNYLLTQSIRGQISFEPLEDIQQDIAFYMENCTDEEKKAEMNELIAKWEKLAQGQPAPVFDGVDLDGNKVSLTDFIGKYVYVDVWATWCGPCLHEIPYSKKLEADYQDKNIVFICCSIDDDEEAWRKMVIEDELAGVHILEEGAWESPIIKDYMISGIPTYLLIDREGNIITVKAPRPSGKIREMLDGLEGI